ncbi:uncharacterized protein LOC132563963 [Ylistrum balloti]|uniref:uncharacterized protein LOC132563963 n=1 Tax=Ylistrum balloti TaxID=509963 RepID=UPI002905D242|nr:uncharacterized protein LOC132563963 [Ylistrum balloti]
MCLGEELYTNNDNLQQGLEFPKGEGDHLSVTYTMMSQLYTAGDKITPSVIKRIFRAEAMAVVRDKEYMGIWQLFALADMLGSTVFSVYPDLGGPVPKAVLGREINPLVLRHRKPLFIMWTSTREDLQKENWIPNHFVPLIQVCGRNENFTDDSDENIELDDSLLDTLLQTVTDSQEMESPIPVIACSQELESPIPVIASSQEMESSIPVIASSQEMESPIPVIASSQEMESPIIAYQGNHHSRSLESPITAISQAMESPIASSQEMESLIASSQEMESLMASSQEMEILMASSQAMESPIASSQETESPIKAYQGNQHVQSPAIIDDENLASVGEQNQATMDNRCRNGRLSHSLRRKEGVG